MTNTVPDIGQNTPDFEVSGSDGKAFKLSEVLEKGTNVKLMFYRGHW